MNNQTQKCRKNQLPILNTPLPDISLGSIKTSFAINKHISYL